MDGHAGISGPLRAPRALQGTMLVDAFTVKVEKIPFTATALSN